jgi:hypothetical protein
MPGQGFRMSGATNFRGHYVAFVEKVCRKGVKNLNDGFTAVVNLSEHLMRWFCFHDEN